MAVSRGRLLVVPRLGGRPDSDWYPWLCSRARDGGRYADTDVLAAPDPDRPEVALWTQRLGRALGRDPRVCAETVVVGHSVGCLALLHVLAGMNVQVRGAVFVAGFFALPRPDAVLQPWVDAPLDLDAASAAARARVALLSTDDPFTPATALARRAWEERCRATVRVVPGAGHFGRAWEPAVWEAVSGL